jgi:hypothetical protein
MSRLVDAHYRDDRWVEVREGDELGPVTGGRHRPPDQTVGRVERVRRQAVGEADYPFQ